MTISEYEKIIDELLDADHKTHPIANKVGNALFSMALDSNSQANLDLKHHLKQQRKIKLQRK